MAYRILAGERPVEALRRIAAERIACALADIDDDRVELHETVHEVRKRCKEIRGLLRLFRSAFPSYSSENARFRDTARRLSDLRDAAARMETCDALSDRFADDRVGKSLLAELREELAGRRDVASRDAGDRIACVRRELEEAAGRVDGWSLEAEGFDAIAGGWKKVYRRARKGMRRACREASVEHLHEWRKRVKYHRYHLRLLRGAWPPVLGPLRDSAQRLSDRLGDDHDLAILRRFVVDEWSRSGDAAVPAVLGLIDLRREELQAWSLPEARRLLGDRPGQRKRGMRRVWQAWSCEQALRSALPDGSEGVS